MYKGKHIAVVMPAYNAEHTLRKAFEEVVAQGVADLVVIVDDCSRDGTERVARSLSEGRGGGVETAYLRHSANHEKYGFWLWTLW